MDSTIVKPFLLDNLENLRQEEERIRTESILHVNADPALKSHIGMIHGCMDTLHWLHQREPSGQISDVDLAIAGLRIRLFNSASSGLKLLLSGYYQGSVSFLRDVLELVFLLDYLEFKQDAIPRWIANPDIDEFKAIKIRLELDKRDGLEQKKRAAMYKLLCTYGAHATFDGFRLMSKNNLLTLGPFFSGQFLSHILPDLATHLPHAVLTCLKFESDMTLNDLKARAGFLNALKEWWKIHRNPDMDTGEIDLINEILNRIS